MAKLLGIDIHRWNGLMNHQVAKDAGAHFCLIRSGGTDYAGRHFVDNQFKRNAELAPEVMPVGYWYVFRPNFDPRKQAAHFINQIRDLRQDIPAQFDNELRGDVSPNTFAANLLLAYGELDAAFPSRRHINYTRAGFFNRYVARRPEWKQQTDLWVARYTLRPQPWGNPGDSSYVYPLDYDDWTFWQWSADHNGRGQEFGAPPPPAADHDMDLDYFNGDLAAFEKYFKINQDKIPKIVEVVNAKNTTLRTEPKGANEAAIPIGTRLGVRGRKIESDGSTWYDVGGYWVLADHVKVIE